jgi:hypothetical protein
MASNSAAVPSGERHWPGSETVLRGEAAKVRHLGDELLATKGVLHGDLLFTSGEGAFNRWK